MTVINSLPNECFQEIFEHVSNQGPGLFSSLLVNKIWCINVVYVLWSRPFEKKYKFVKTPIIIQTYLRFLSIEDRKEIETLINKNTHSESDGGGYDVELTRKPLFDYPKYLKELDFQVFVHKIVEWAGTKNKKLRNQDNYNDIISLIIDQLIRLFSRKSNNLDYLSYCASRSWSKAPNFEFLNDDDNNNSISSINNEGNVNFLINLTQFQFHIWNLNDDDDGNIVKFVNLVGSSSKKIRKLDISYGDDKEENITNSIIELIKKQRNLYDILIKRHSNNISSLIKALECQSNSLRSLSIKDAIFDIEDFKILSKFRNIYQLAMENCAPSSKDFKNNYYPKYQNEFIKSSGKNCKRLITNFFTVEIGNAIINHCDNIEEFKIIGILTPCYPIVIRVLNNFKNSLKKLSLRFDSNPMEEVNLINLLKNNLPLNLEYLRIVINNEGDLKELSDLLSSNEIASLNTLIIQNNNHKHETEILKIILNFVNNNKISTLKTLGMNYKKRDDEKEAIELNRKLVEDYKIQIYHIEDLKTWF
ncbi:2446_t:CDS:2 [Entrophospora sp. SA101]|nr:2446_t:CDS:2 [Entrophospora sp. SA101]